MPSTALEGIEGLRWARWVDDFVFCADELSVVLEALASLEKALGEKGFRLASNKTVVGSPGSSVFRDNELDLASTEVERFPSGSTEVPPGFARILQNVLDRPWSASIRNVSFVVNRVIRHPEFFDLDAWVRATPHLSHAAEYLARLVLSFPEYRAALEPRLPVMFLEPRWNDGLWAVAKLLGAWERAPKSIELYLRQRVERGGPEGEAVLPGFVSLLSESLTMNEFRFAAERATLWFPHRALWLAAGGQGASRRWLEGQVARFEEHEILQVAFDCRGEELFRRPSTFDVGWEFDELGPSRSS